MNGGDGCTTMWTYVMPLPVPLQVGAIYISPEFKQMPPAPSVPSPHCLFSAPLLSWYPEDSQRNCVVSASPPAPRDWQPLCNLTFDFYCLSWVGSLRHKCEEGLCKWINKESLSGGTGKEEERERRIELWSSWGPPPHKGITDLPTWDKGVGFVPPH